MESEVNTGLALLGSGQIMWGLVKREIYWPAQTRPVVTTAQSPHNDGAQTWPEKTAFGKYSSTRSAECQPTYPVLENSYADENCAPRTAIEGVATSAEVE
jgi:hypothetical protein